jgi:acyl-coenzyme A thioesterase PaaI-like protein
MDGGSPDTEIWTLRPIAEGPWAGWAQWANDPFEALSGPFYTRKDADGRPRCAFRTEPRHMNASGGLHGGCAMTFADFSLFIIAYDVLEGTAAVTASFTGDFLGGVGVGALVECRGEVVKAGRSMVFVRGLMTSGDEPVMSFQAVIKKTGPRPA